MTFTRFALASLLAVVAADVGSAADMSRAPVIYDQTMVPQEVGTGWYLRGDVGYAWTGKPDVSYGGTAFSGVSAGDPWIAAAGFGYKFNDIFRADLTFERINSFRAKGGSTCATWTTADCADTALTTRESTSLSGWAVLANGYADLGNWEGITPYVGAGLGFARMSAGHSSLTEGLTDPTRTFGSTDTWSFAAAGMAGASYTIASGLDVDLGYRFLWIDHAETGASIAEAGKVKVKDMTSHEFRVGLRYYPF